MNKLSLIITTFNEEKSMGIWCDSILAQTRLPDEIVLVDSMSTDNTVNIIKNKLSSTNITLSIFIEKCNISKGRNIAISKARYDNILVTDAGVELSHTWIELMAKKLSECDVVAGYYSFSGEQWFQKSYSRLFYKSPEQIDESTFLPSSRSLALTRKAWESVSGYNESYDIGEDTEFDLKLKSRGYGISFEPNALVTWELRDSLYKLSKQHYLYSYWDGVIGQNKKGNSFLSFYFLMFSLILTCPVFHYFLFLLIPVLFLNLKRIRRSRSEQFREKAQDLLVMNICYLSKGLGFITGSIRRKYGFLNDKKIR